MPPVSQSTGTPTTPLRFIFSELITPIDQANHLSFSSNGFKNASLTKMRGDTWPGGALRQFHVPHLIGDGAPGTVPTISGVLHVREGLWGHKWVYKLHETHQQVVEHELESRFWIRTIAVTAILILVAVGIGFTLFGPKYLDFKVQDTKTWPPEYINTRLKIILNLTNKSRSQFSTKDQNDYENQEQSFGCLNCSASEICLQNPAESDPKCVPVKDPRDPTGCGGLCALEVQFCKRLSPWKEIYSCLEIQRLVCTGNQWKCTETLLCIDRDRICDGIIHCFDQSDEFNCECDLEKSFRCGNNISCFPNARRCDGAVDCWDAGDEKNCTQECGPLKMPCYNGDCIASDTFCDGVFDCSDKSDEPRGCIESKTTRKRVA